MDSEDNYFWVGLGILNVFLLCLVLVSQHFGFIPFLVVLAVINITIYICVKKYGH